MDSEASYPESLNELKQAMFGGCELPIIARMIGSAPKRRRLKLIDIGAGNGEFLARVRSEFPSTHFDQIVCVEPDAANFASLKTFHPDALVFQERFQEVRIIAPADVVTAMHSIYYLGDTSIVVNKLRDIMTPGGIAIISSWSRRCALFQMAATAASVGVRPIHHEAILADLELLVSDSVQILDHDTHSSFINTRRLAELDDRLLRGVLGVILRNNEQLPSALGRIRKQLIEFEGQASRVNGVIALKFS